MLMRVEFYKGGDGRLCSWVATLPHRRPLQGSTMAAGRDLPHDLTQFTIERALDVRDGFWGLLAHGASFDSVPGCKPTREGRALVRAHHASLVTIEGVVNGHYQAWRRGEPTPLRGTLDAMYARWLGLADAEPLALEWTVQPLPSPTKRVERQPQRVGRRMSRRALSAAIAILLLSGATACGVVSSVRPRVGTATGSTTRPGEPTAPGRPPGTDPSTGTPTGSGRPTAERGTRYADERRICRTSGSPRGWIAVAYVSAPDECPPRAGADSVASATTAALITYYADRPRGAVLDVCADQPTPVGWQTATDEAAEHGDRCLGASRGGGPTTKRIRRIQ